MEIGSIRKKFKLLVIDINTSDLFIFTSDRQVSELLKTTYNIILSHMYIRRHLQDEKYNILINGSVDLIDFFKPNYSLLINGNNIYLKEDFYVSSSNKEAYDFIVSWPKWIRRTANIFGPPGSGKTHLSSIFKKKTSTLKIESNSLNDKIFFKFKTKEALIIENLT